MKFTPIKIIIIILIILVSFHLKQYLKKNNKYEILQINDEINNYEKHFNENLPLILKNHNIESIKNKLSTLTIKTNNINNFNIENLYMTHRNNSLLIFGETEFKVNISTPDQYKYFEFSKCKYPVEVLNTKSNNFSSITIIIRPGNLLFIPRFWIFNIENTSKVSLLQSDTIFSYLFKIVHFK